MSTVTPNTSCLWANIEEARYQVLRSGRGKTITPWRYAVRTTTEKFVKTGVPPGETVLERHLCQGKKPAKPGQPADGQFVTYIGAGLRGGEDKPCSLVEILSYQPKRQLGPKKASNDLDRLDLPVCRGRGFASTTSPLSSTAEDTGAFEKEAYYAPLSQLLVRLAPPRIRADRRSPQVLHGAPQSSLTGWGQFAKDGGTKKTTPRRKPFG